MVVGEGVCVAVGGHAWLSGACGCGGHAWWQGGMHGGEGCVWWQGGACMGYDEIRSMSEW